MNTLENIAFSRQTVLNFRFFDQEAMRTTARDLSLLLTERELFVLRDHFRTYEQRDPSVGELQFFSGAMRLWRRSPDSIEIARISGDDEQTRVWRDICRMREALPKAPATLTALMDTAAAYMARGGILPYHGTLCCDDAAEISLRAVKMPATPALRLGAVSAFLDCSEPARCGHTDLLVLLRPTESEPPEETAVRFLTRQSNLALTPIALVGEEGMLPHLLALGKGFILDLFPFTAPEECTASSALTVGQGTLLFRTSAEALHRLYEAGEPVIACGVPSELPCVQIRHGSDVHLSVSSVLFAALGSIRSLSIDLPPTREERLALRVAETNGTLLGGVAVRGGCAEGVLALIGDMLQRGADPDRMTLTAALELPYVEKQSKPVADALPCVTELHRLTAELMLVCHRPQTISRAKQTDPLLTVFVCAERKEPRAEDFSKAWQDAATRRDHGALRRLMRPQLSF